MVKNVEKIILKSYFTELLELQNYNIHPEFTIFTMKFLSLKPYNEYGIGFK
jgi:hypothetical protein